MSQKFRFVLVILFVVPVSMQAQQQDSEAVAVSLAALEGLQAYGVLPADAEQLRAIRIDREQEVPARDDRAEARYAFDRKVLGAAGVTREPTVPSAPECEHRAVDHPDRDGVVRTHWMARCELPEGLVPVSFRVANIDRAEARVWVRWMTVAEGEEFLTFPASYSLWEVRVTRAGDAFPWQFDSVVSRSSSAIHPRPST